jgi:hypothetical protein
MAKNNEFEHLKNIQGLSDMVDKADPSTLRAIAQSVEVARIGTYGIVGVDHLLIPLMPPTVAEKLKDEVLGTHTNRTPEQLEENRSPLPRQSQLRISPLARITLKAAIIDASDEGRKATPTDLLYALLETDLEDELSGFGRLQSVGESAYEMRQQVYQEKYSHKVQIPASQYAT